MHIASIAKNLGTFVSSNSPTILTSVAVAGVVSTSVLAVRATPQAFIDIQDAKSERTEPLSKLEIIELSWKYYVPALAVGGATIACIVGSHSVSTRRNAALLSVYSITESAFKDYKEKVTERVGPEEEAVIREEVAKDRMKRTEAPDREYIMTGSGDVLCFDVLTGRYFQSDIETLRAAQNTINAQIINEMYASQNDFYREIGLPPTRVGEDLGWNHEHFVELEFTGTLTADNRPCLSIDYRVAPKERYYKLN